MIDNIVSQAVRTYKLSVPNHSIARHIVSNLGEQIEHARIGYDLQSLRDKEGGESGINVSIIEIRRAIEDF